MAHIANLEARINAIVSNRSFGTATAAKRGRRREWPYVPVIVHQRGIRINGTRTEQIRGKAFATRDEAVAYAAAVIEARKNKLRDDLLTPRYRALRKQYGLPEEICAAA